MTITLARPTTDEILLAAAAETGRLHTTKMFARNLRHGSLFMLAPIGFLRRMLGTARHCTVDGQPVVELMVQDGDQQYTMLVDINGSVYGVVGAI